MYCLFGYEGCPPYSRSQCYLTGCVHLPLPKELVHVVVADSWDRVWISDDTGHGHVPLMYFD